MQNVCDILLTGIRLPCITASFQKDFIMPVIALASSKGGCGKSTTALILASAFSSDGYRVRIIDADRSKRLERWGKSEQVCNLVSVVHADDQTLSAAVDKGRGEADVVIIDVEGSANMVLAYAVGYADAVIVPANPSAPDVEDAVQTVALIRSTAKMVRKDIPYALLWSRVPTAIRSREIKALEAQVSDGGIPVLGRVFERTAFKSMFSFGATLDSLSSSDVPGLEKAKAEALELAALVIDLVKKSDASGEEA